MAKLSGVVCSEVLFHYGEKFGDINVWINILIDRHLSYGRSIRVLKNSWKTCIMKKLCIDFRRFVFHQNGLSITHSMKFLRYSVISSQVVALPWSVRVCCIAPDDVPRCCKTSLSNLALLPALNIPLPCTWSGPVHTEGLIQLSCHASWLWRATTLYLKVLWVSGSFVLLSGVQII